MGSDYAEVLEEMKTLHKRTSPYYPRTNEKVERLNGIIKTMLRKMLLNMLELEDTPRIAWF